MWISIWDNANSIEWSARANDIDNQLDGASELFKQYAMLYKAANEGFFNKADESVMNECILILKDMRERFDRDDWERLIASTCDKRAKFEYRRMMNAKFPENAQSNCNE